MKKENKVYSDALKHPLWQKKRLEIMQRDDFTCQFCGSKDRTLHIHHKRYEHGKKPWEYNDDELITLCDRCHENITEEKNELYDNFTYARDSFRKFGFSDSIFNAILININSFFENIENNEKHWDFDIIRSVIFNAVMGTQNYNDIKTLARLGEKVRDLVKTYYPMFLEDYDNTNVDDNIKLLID